MQSESSAGFAKVEGGNYRREKDNAKEREVLERKILQPNNELCDAKMIEKQPTTKSIEKKQSRPTHDHHPCMIITLA